MDLNISEHGITLISKSPSQTLSLGYCLGSVIHKGSLICLEGDLGTGKTVFTKGIASSLSVKNADREVVSPTFLLVKEYEGKWPLTHIDLYRIDHAEALNILGFQEYIHREGVVVVEWADKATMPDKRIRVKFVHLMLESREIQISGLTDSINERLIKKINEYIK